MGDARKVLRTLQRKGWHFEMKPRPDACGRGAVGRTMRTSSLTKSRATRAWPRPEPP